MEKNIFLKRPGHSEEIVNLKSMVGLIALQRFPPLEDFREVMKNLVYSFLMRKQPLQLDTVHVGTAYGISIGNIWTILKNIGQKWVCNF